MAYVNVKYQLIRMINVRKREISRERYIVKSSYCAAQLPTRVDRKRVIDTLLLICATTTVRDRDLRLPGACMRRMIFLFFFYEWNRHSHRKQWT